MSQNTHKFYYITVATKPHQVLERLQNHVTELGETLTVLGLQENRVIGWQHGQRFGVKLREVYDFIHRPDLGSNDIVLFTDAYDVAYCGNREEVLRKYTNFIKPIVFGAERHCNPDPSRVNEYPLLPAPTEFPFLNSGMFIGRVWALSQCMHGYTYEDTHDDQRFWTTQYLTRPDLIELDYHNKLFLNIVDINMRLFFWNQEDDTVMYKNATPLFIHDNGPVKNLIKP